MSCFMSLRYMHATAFQVVNKIYACSCISHSYNKMYASMLIADIFPRLELFMCMLDKK